MAEKKLNSSVSTKNKWTETWHSPVENNPSFYGGGLEYSWDVSSSANVVWNSGPVTTSGSNTINMTGLPVNIFGMDKNINLSSGDVKAIQITNISSESIYVGLPFLHGLHSDDDIVSGKWNPSTLEQAFDTHPLKGSSGIHVGEAGNCLLSNKHGWVIDPNQTDSKFSETQLIRIASDNSATYEITVLAYHPKGAFGENT